MTKSMKITWMFNVGSLGIAILAWIVFDPTKELKNFWLLMLSLNLIWFSIVRMFEITNG